ncbi:MAG: coaBC 2 [Verrucomicrobiales bacterium]|nr:coaBC 2 [Verrucomicrobiales bacterium]
MKVIVTCGPSYEPIDQVRRLTNFSTGELGVQLSDELGKAGFEVFCLKGSCATFPGPGANSHVRLFNTNDDLVRLLEQIGGTHEIAAVFHVAALCDYKVKDVEDDQGNQRHSAKIASRSGGLTIHLEPATKVISGMRAIFPGSLLVGWKYELEGTSEEAIASGMRQIVENRTDACVVNGKAYGEGFAFCRPGRTMHPFRNKAKLVRFLSDWLTETIPGTRSATDQAD